MNTLLDLSVSPTLRSTNRPKPVRWPCNAARLQRAPIIQRTRPCPRDPALRRWDSVGGADAGAEPLWQTVMGCVLLASLFAFAWLVL
jgi:hypothetical protein